MILSPVTRSNRIMRESVSGKFPSESLVVSFLSIYPIRILGEISIEFVNLISSMSRSPLSSNVPVCVRNFQVCLGITETISISDGSDTSFSFVKSRTDIQRTFPPAKPSINTDLDPSIVWEIIGVEILRLETNHSVERTPISVTFSHFFITQTLFLISVPIRMNSHHFWFNALSISAGPTVLSLLIDHTGAKMRSSFKIYDRTIWSPLLILILSERVVLPLAVSVRVYRAGRIGEKVHTSVQSCWYESIVSAIGSPSTQNVQTRETEYSIHPLTWNVNLATFCVVR